MIIRIKNLKLRTIIGINEWERDAQQDVIVNISIEFDGKQAGRTDDIESTVNYKSLKKRIIELVESSEYFLLEKLVDSILKVIMEDSKVLKATVEVDKPNALRFADSVSVEGTAERSS